MQYVFVADDIIYNNNHPIYTYLTEHLNVGNLIQKKDDTLSFIMGSRTFKH